jgi:hypothetical protein
MSKRKSHEEFIKLVEDKFGSDYTILSKYVKIDVKIRVKHNLCDYEWETYPQNFTTGQSKCPSCSKRIKYTTESFGKYVSEATNGEYALISGYSNMKKKVSIKHLLCGCEWQVFPRDFKNRSTRCPNCKSSKGEKKLFDFLTQNNIVFEQQHTNENCKSAYLLRFDFAIFNKDNELVCLLEYDGQHHFKPTDFAGRGKEWADNQLKEIKEKDKIKNIYCRDNSISLIRIPYWKFEEIDLILNNLLNKKYPKVDENFIVI